MLSDVASVFMAETNLMPLSASVLGHKMTRFSAFHSTSFPLPIKVSSETRVMSIGLLLCLTSDRVGKVF